MHRNLLYIFIFFILISSLASAQWESDQLLFSPKIKSPRPKAKKLWSAEKNLSGPVVVEKPELNIISDDSNKSQPMSVSLNQLQNESQTGKRSLASEEQSMPVALELQVGSMSFNSSSTSKDMQFSSSALSYGAQISIPLQKINKLNLTYFSSTEFTVRKNDRKKWEDFKLNYLFGLDNFNQEFYLGAFVRQSSWWQSSSSIDVVPVQTFNSIGINGVYSLPKEGSRKSHLLLQLSPYLRNGDNSFTGSTVSIDWYSYYDKGPGRSFLFNIGYEALSLKEKKSAFNMDQGILKFGIGYQLSPAK